MSAESFIWVTGSAGRLGTAVVRALRKAGLPVRGFDLKPTPLATESVVADLSNRDALQSAASGVRTLIHLAAMPDDSEEPDFFSKKLVPTNIVGLYNVLEAARVAGIPRVVLASSGQVNWTQQYHGPLPVGAKDPITPRHWYAATKVFMESVGYSYAQNLGRTTLAIRLGWCPRLGQAPEIASNLTAQDLYLSPGDAGRFFLRTVEANVPQGFHILYAASRPLRAPIFDLKPAQDLLQWTPLEQWPTGAESEMPE